MRDERAGLVGESLLVQKSKDGACAPCEAVRARRRGAYALLFQCASFSMPFRRRDIEGRDEHVPVIRCQLA